MIVAQHPHRPRPTGSTTVVRPLVVPRRDPRHRVPRLGHPGRAERDGGDHRRRRRRPGEQNLAAGDPVPARRRVPRRQHRLPRSGAASAPRIDRRADAPPEDAQAPRRGRTDQIATRGGLLLVTARFIPGGRTVLTLTCGHHPPAASGSPSGSAIAAVIWATYAAGLGYVFGAALRGQPHASRSSSRSVRRWP